MLTWRETGRIFNDIKDGLNPYSNGMLTWFKKMNGKNVVNPNVLILILMECSLGKIKTETFKQGIPYVLILILMECSLGKEHGKKMLRKHVLILILMECSLGEIKCGNLTWKNLS